MPAGGVGVAAAERPVSLPIVRSVPQLVSSRRPALILVLSRARIKSPVPSWLPSDSAAWGRWTVTRRISLVWTGRDRSPPHCWTRRVAGRSSRALASQAASNRRTSCSSAPGTSWASSRNMPSASTAPSSSGRNMGTDSARTRGARAADPLTHSSNKPGQRLWQRSRHPQIKDKVKAKTYRSTRHVGLDELVTSLNLSLTGMGERLPVRGLQGDLQRPAVCLTTWVRTAGPGSAPSHPGPAPVGSM
jgi:hypothetical protein